MYLYALFLTLPSLGIAYPIFANSTNNVTPTYHIPIIPSSIFHHDRSYSESGNPRALRFLYPRDSITIDISSSFAKTTVSNAQNNARFQVINNAKNSAIAVGDDASHNVTFDSFGDKNMVNSTGSATGGWNTKNHRTNISTEPRSLKRGNTALESEKRDLVNLNVLNGKIKGSNVTSSGNGNTVELHIVGKGDDVVNITIVWEAEESNMEDSINNNTVKIYIENMKDDMVNDTMVVV